MSRIIHQTFYLLLISIFMVSCTSSLKVLPEASASPIPTATQIPTSKAMTVVPSNTPTQTPVTSTPIPDLFFANQTPLSAMVGYWDFAVGVYPATDTGMVKGATIEYEGTKYPKGLFAHAPSRLVYALDGTATQLVSEAFIVPGCSDGARFSILLDDQSVFSADVFPGRTPVHIAVDTTGAKQLVFLVEPGGNGLYDCDWAVWGDPHLIPSASDESPLPSDGLSASMDLSDQIGLTEWVKNYVNAYGGKAKVGGVEMTADQLIAEIRSNSKVFEQSKMMNEEKATFLVVNDTPLAILLPGKTWRSVLARDMADELNIDFALPALFTDISDPRNAAILMNANTLTMTNDLGMNVVFSNFGLEDWKRVLSDWESIQPVLDQGELPGGFPYDWHQADAVFEFAQRHQMRVKAQHLLDSGDVIPDIIYHAGFNREELLRILEFTTSVTVSHYRGKVSEWDVQEEQVVADIHKSGNEKYGFWMREVGLIDATEIVARTVKKLDPDSKSIITENYILEDQVGTQHPELRNRFFAYLRELKQKGIPVDGVDIENNAWVYNPPQASRMKPILIQIKDLGYYLSAPETTVIMTEDHYPIWYEPVRKTAMVNDPIADQATIFRSISEAYLEVDARGIGFGDVADVWSFLNYSGNQDADPALFDDNCAPKQAYYAILEVLYNRLPQG